jgi:hypothetical protein
LGALSFGDVLAGGEDSDGVSLGVLENLGGPFNLTLLPVLCKNQVAAVPLAVLQGLQKSCSQGVSLGFRQEGGEPILALYVFHTVAGNLLQIGVEAHDPPYGVEDEDDDLCALEQIFGKLLIAPQGFFHLFARS